MENKVKERIKKIRKELNLTQQQFANRIGVKRGGIANYEIGRNEPTDSVISLICREFNVNEKWLRTGNGDMFQRRTKNEELLNFMNNVMELEDNNFKKKLVNALVKLDIEDWKYLEIVARKLLSED